MNSEQSTKAENALFDGIMSILQAITSELSESGANTERVKNLAEAYAWLRSPNQPH